MLKDAVLKGGQFHRRAAHLYGLRAGVEHHRAALKLRGCPATGAPQQCLHPRQHFLEMKGLGDVIIGSGLQALDLVLPVVARGQNQNRIGLARRPQAADELESRQPGSPRSTIATSSGCSSAGEQALLAVTRRYRP